MTTDSLQPTIQATASEKVPAILTLMNRLMIPLLRSPLHSIASHTLVLPSFQGRKSGKTYTFPTGYTRQGNQLEIIGESDRFLVVRWDRLTWVCSCGKGTCEHKLKANEFMAQEFVQSRMLADDLAAHLDDATSLQKDGIPLTEQVPEPVIGDVHTS